jgi:hypothetical protein
MSLGRLSKRHGRDEVGGERTSLELCLKSLIAMQVTRSIAMNSLMNLLKASSRILFTRNGFLSEHCLMKRFREHFCLSGARDMSRDAEDPVS